MEKDSEIKELYQTTGAIDNNNTEIDFSSRTKKYRRIKGINGDFTIVDEHGCVVAEGLGL